MTRFLGLISARGGSKGIPRKNLVPLAGKPLIQYTLEAALNCRSLDRVILSTDDEEIAEFGRQAGVEVPFIRPAALATDDASTRSVQRHALEWCQQEEGTIPDALVTLQPTSPLRTSRHIDEAVSRFQTEQADSVLGVTPVQDHPYEVVGFSEGRMYRAVDRPAHVVRRQQYPPFYKINGAIYVTKSSVLINLDTGYGERVFDYAMEWEESVDVDSLHDLGIADALLQAAGTEKHNPIIVNGN
jgi:CMP-N,N'-diacetyllegionaminic acid synthase